MFSFLKSLHFIIGKKNFYKLFLFSIPYLIISILDIVSVSLLSSFFFGVGFLNENTDTNINTNYKYILILSLIIIVKFLIIFFNNYKIHKFNSSVLIGIRKRIFDKYANISLEDHNKTDNEKKMYNLINVCLDFSSKVIIGFIKAFGEFIIISVLIFYLIIFHTWSIFFIIFNALILFIIYKYIFFKISKKSAKNINDGQLKLMSTIKNILNGFREIKLLNSLKSFDSEFDLNNEKTANGIMKFQIINILPRYVLEFFIFINLIIIIFLSTKFVENFNFILISIASLSFVFFRLISSSAIFFNSLNNFSYGRDLISRIIEILNLSNVNYSSNNKEDDTFDNLKIKNLTFGFKNRTIFSNVNFSISSGDKILITGNSGVGKSTFIDILSGFYKQTYKYIDLNGLEVNNFNQFKNFFSICSQKGYIINGTLKYNLTMGDDRKPKLLNEIYDLLELKSIEPLDSKKIILNDGSEISGGQIQRINIGRVIYLDLPIMIFDESTSNLDKIIETKILNYLLSKKNKTVVFISHNDNFKKYFNNKLIISENKIIHVK